MPRTWASHLERVQAVQRAALREFVARVDCEPDVRAQLQAAVEAIVKGVKNHVAVYPDGCTDAEQDVVVKELSQLADEAVRAVAEAQRQRRLAHRASKRGRRPPLRSVSDGWRWRIGRPPQCSVANLLFWVEVWRDGRDISRADALAEVMANELRKKRLADYRRVQDRRRRYEREDRLAPSAALTRAVKDLFPRRFRSLEAQFSKALLRYAPGRVITPTIK